MSRRGGEAVKLTELQGGRFGPRLVTRFEAPGARGLGRGSGRRARCRDGEEEPAAKEKTAKPIVLRRLQFKRDGEGYLRELRSHVHVFDVAKKTSFQLTSGPFDDSDPVWSPDGHADRLRQQPHAAGRRPFAEQRHLRGRGASEGEVPRARRDRPEPRPRAPPGAPTGSRSPSSRAATRRTCGTARATWRSFPAAGGAPRPLTAALDRNVLLAPLRARRPLAAVPDRGRRQPAPGARRRRGRRRRARRRRRAGGAGLRRRRRAEALVVLESSPHQPPEISAASPRRTAADHARERRVPEGHPARRGRALSRPRARTAPRSTAS